MKERAKDVLTNGIILLAGIGLGALAMALLGCGNGLPWLGTGIILESLLDPSEQAEDGVDGTHCWDANANGECDDEDDVNGDEVCTVEDCVGAPGENGSDGENAGPPVVINIHPRPAPITPTYPPPVDEEDPPHGNAWGSDGPHGNQNRP